MQYSIKVVQSGLNLAVIEIPGRYIPWFRPSQSHSSHLTTNMPGIINPPDFKHIAVKELHPTFGAEVSGVDFSKEVTGEVFREILAAITKVSHPPVIR